MVRFMVGMYSLVTDSTVIASCGSLSRAESREEIYAWNLWSLVCFAARGGDMSRECLSEGENSGYEGSFGPRYFVSHAAGLIDPCLLHIHDAASKAGRATEWDNRRSAVHSIATRPICILVAWAAHEVCTNEQRTRDCGSVGIGSRYQS